MLGKLFELPLAVFRCARIQGFITIPEAISLYWMSYGKGRVVEIGSLMGKSTVCLMYGGNHVTTIDHHRGSPELEGLIPEDTESIVRHNLRKFKNIDIAVGRSRDVAKKWDRKDGIDFLFIDGCHDYLNAMHDLTNWSNFVNIGGLIAIHDYNFDDVRRAVSYAIAVHQFEILKRSGSLLYLRRVE